MIQRMPPQRLPRAQRVAERAFATLEHFLHIEAVSGVALLLAAAVALLLANSPWSTHYESLWHTPIGLQVGSFGFSQSLHFWINDGLMTLFFLVVGMEIRREMHEGALSQARQAALPIAAAIGGVLLPALLYLALNRHSPAQHGWAIPTATDIAFATGMLALLGRAIPGNIRVFLLALAIIDDIIAVLVIAVFYSDGLRFGGFILAGAGLSMAWALQRIGIGAAYAYVIPGIVVWTGLLTAGVHPTLAGVALGLLTPVRAMPTRERPEDIVSRVTGDVIERKADPNGHPSQLASPLRALRSAQRELLPPVIRVQNALHPWVAYGIMPLFAFANAGVALGGAPLASEQLRSVMLGVTVALVLGKPLGVFCISWILVRLGWCSLPSDVSWGGIGLIGLLAGVGFTMSMFIAMLAFSDQQHLAAAKLGVLLASLVASVLGLAWGWLYRRGLAKANRAMKTAPEGA